MNHKNALIWIASLLLLFMLAGCVAPEPPAPTPTPNPDAATPAEIVTVRTAAVEYMREGARCFVPARLSLYKPVVDGPYNEPDAYDVYRFESENCIVTVTTEHDAPAEPLYHVTIGDQDTGYCLQAIVSETGQVLHSGSSAAMADNPGNFSAQFCKEQGYSYEIVQRADGGQCGACVFPDGSSCQSWEFFHGICGPGEGTFTPE
jgi:putative hemolysin